MITIVLPVHNEEVVLKDNTLKVVDFCRNNLKDNWQVVISDNASNDRTRERAEKLVAENKEIKYFRSEKQGKGVGVIEAWKNFKSDIYLYMDIDLAADLKHINELVAGMRQGYDIVAGSRFAAGSVAKRSWIRRFISRGLRQFLKLFLGLKVQDAPCGFKAVNERVIREIIPFVKNRDWFFDTEMLVLAEAKKFKIQEIGICWQDKITRDRESKVELVSVICEYLKNIYRLKKEIKK